MRETRASGAVLCVSTLPLLLPVAASSRARVARAAPRPFAARPSSLCRDPARASRSGLGFGAHCRPFRRPVAVRYDERLRQLRFSRARQWSRNSLNALAQSNMLCVCCAQH